MAVPSGVMGLGVQGPSETGFEGQGLTEAGSGGLGVSKVGFGGQRLNEAGFGMQGPNRAGSGGLRHPARQLWGQTPHEADGELPIPSQRTEVWALWGAFWEQQGLQRRSMDAEAAPHPAELEGFTRILLPEPSQNIAGGLCVALRRV